MVDYFDDNLFERDETSVLILINRSYKYISIELIYIKELMLRKIITVKNVSFVTIGLLVMGLNLKHVFVMIVVICCC